MKFADFDVYVRFVLDRIAEQDVIDDINGDPKSSWGPHTAIGDTFINGFSVHDAARYISYMCQDDDFYLTEDEAIKEMTNLSLKYASRLTKEARDARAAEYKAAMKR
jgi:hypothetical protein